MTACQSGGGTVKIEGEATAVPKPTAVPPAIEPTATSAALPTVPPRPTAAPPGAYINGVDGFTFHYPVEWVVAEDGRQGLQVYSNSSGIMLSVFSDPKTDETNYDLYKVEFSSRDLMESWGLKDVELIAEDEVPFAADFTAQTAVFTATDVHDGLMELWIAYAESEKSEFFIFAYSMTGEDIPNAAENDETRRVLLNQLLADAEVSE